MKMKLISLLLLGTLTLFSLAAVAAPEAPVGLPTRPAPSPTTEPNFSGFSGGQILLRADQGDSTVGLWMQWQDPYTGEWHDVDGWRGHFDGDGEVTWWVGTENLDSGPFRWRVYSDETETNLLLTSDEFMLPAHSGEIVTVAVDLP